MCALALLLMYYHPHVVYLIWILPACIMLLPVLFNCVDEERISPDEFCEVRKHCLDQVELVVLVFMIGLSCVIIMIEGLVQDNVWVSLKVGLVFGAVIMAGPMLFTAMVGRCSI